MHLGSLKRRQMAAFVIRSGNINISLNVFSLSARNPPVGDVPTPKMAHQNRGTKFAMCLPSLIRSATGGSVDGSQTQLEQRWSGEAFDEGDRRSLLTATGQPSPGVDHDGEN